MGEHKEAAQLALCSQLQCDAASNFHCAAGTEITNCFTQFNEKIMGGIHLQIGVV